MEKWYNKKVFWKDLVIILVSSLFVLGVPTLTVAFICIGHQTDMAPTATRIIYLFAVWAVAFLFCLFIIVGVAVPKAKEEGNGKDQQSAEEEGS